MCFFPPLPSLLLRCHLSCNSDNTEATVERNYITLRCMEGRCHFSPEFLLKLPICNMEGIGKGGEEKTVSHVTAAEGNIKENKL